MMYVSFRNLPKSLFVLALLTALSAGTLTFASTANANAPYSGVNQSGKHQYGPDGQGKPLSGSTKYASPLDAYGNPIVPLEEKPRKVPIERTLKMPKPTRPLPDLPEEPLSW